MVRVRLSDGTEREFPGASYDYRDGRLTVRSAEGETLEEFDKADIRGFAAVEEPAEEPEPASSE